MNSQKTIFHIQMILRPLEDTFATTSTPSSLSLRLSVVSRSTLQTFVHRLPWFTFLSSLTNLKSAYFGIEGTIENDGDEAVAPAELNLPQLTSLLISVTTDDDTTILEFDPFLALIGHVKMPSLDELSLTRGVGWNRDGVVNTLYPILESAPNITFLALGPYITTSLTNDSDAVSDNMYGVISPINPISSYAPSLETLYIVWEAFPAIVNKEETLPGQFLEELCFSEGWLPH